MSPRLLLRLCAVGSTAAILVALALSACDQIQVIVAEAASVEVSPESMTIEIDETRRLQAVIRDATGTVLGAHSVLWASSDPTKASVDVNGDVLGVSVGVATVTARSGAAIGSAQVIVESLPGFALDRTVVSLAAAPGAVAGPETVLISGTGANPTTGLTTSIQYLQAKTGWLLVALSSTSTPASMQISASTQGLAPGIYAADLVVSADRVPSQGIRVTLTVSQPPTIGFSPSFASFTAPQGGPNPQAQTVVVSNLGSDSITGLQGSVSYAPGQPSGWLSAVLGATTAPADLTLSINVGSLAQGTYTASVDVSSPDAANSPQALPVTLVVGSSLPRLQLTRNSVSFSTSFGGPDPPSTTVGVNNSGGGTLDQLSTSISYSGAQAGWLAASLNTTTAPATLTLGASASGLPVGTHSASVTVSSPAAANGSQVVSVQFTIGNSPSISLGTTSLSFSAVSGGSPPASKSVSISNGGGGTLDGLSVASISYGSGSGWLGASLASGTAPTTVNVTPDPGSLGPGTYTATVSIASSASGVTNSPQTFGVTFVVAPPPTISFSPSASVTVSGFTGGPAVVNSSRSVVNGGGGGAGALTGLSVTGQPAWMTATVASTSPATLTITADPGALAEATYNATLQIWSTTPNVSNSPANFNVTFNVGPPPTIELDSAAVRMDGLEFPGLPLGESRQVNVTNMAAGGGPNDLQLNPPNVVYSSGSGWLAALWNTTTSPAVLTLTTDSHRTSLAPGTYTADVEVTAFKATNNPQSISVTFVVDNAPSILLTPTILPDTFFADLSDNTTTPVSQVVHISNDIGNGAGGTASSIMDIDKQLSNEPVGGVCTHMATDTAWLGVTFSQTTSPADMTIAPTAVTLGATGVYCGRIKVISRTAKNSGGPDIVVVFDVRP